MDGICVNTLRKHTPEDGTGFGRSLFANLGSYTVSTYLFAYLFARGPCSWPESPRSLSITRQIFKLLLYIYNTIRAIIRELNSDQKQGPRAEVVTILIHIECERWWAFEPLRNIGHVATWMGGNFT